MSNTCEQAVAEYFAAIRAMDPDRWANTFAPDAVSHDPVGAPPMVGHEALRNFLAGIKASFASASLTEESVHVNGSSAAVKWIARATAHDGRTVNFSGIDVIDCNDQGKITLVRAFWDPNPVMAIAQAK
jgi:steroid delta-isomerase